MGHAHPGEAWRAWPGSPPESSLDDWRQATAPRVDVVRRCVDEGSVRNGDHEGQMKPNDSIFCCSTTSSVTASTIF